MAKKLKILKNNITALFHAKMGWKRLRKRENKNYRSISFLSDPYQKIQKKQPKKFKKLKMPVWHYLKPEQDGNCRERKTINIVVPFRYHPTRNR